MSHLSLSRGLVYFSLLAAISAPLLEGILPVLPALIILAPIISLTFYAYGATGCPPLLKKSALALVSFCIMVTVVDLVSRPLLLLVSRPRIISPMRLPKTPELSRQVPNSAYAGPLYGDLAAMSGQRSWRETREVTYATDAFGFRNDAGGPTTPLDIIMLGDSFGVGTGTSQENTWLSLLQREHNLAAYNLSVDGASPWQEYMTLSMEIGRLKVRPGTVVLWALFESNDLDELYLPIYDKDALPTRGPLEMLTGELRDFRYASPIRQFLLHGFEGRSKVLSRDAPAGTMLFYADYVEATRRTSEDVRRHPNFQQLRATIAAMKRLVDEKGLRIAIVCIPDKARIYQWVLDQKEPWSEELVPSPFAQVVRDLATDSGFSFLDLAPPLYSGAKGTYARSPGTYVWWRDDTHWNDLGHRIAADAVYESTILPLLQQVSEPGSLNP